MPVKRLILKSALKGFLNILPMLYIIWTVFNAFVFCLFLWLAYKAMGMVRDKFGWAASVVLVVGLLSFMSAPKDEEEKDTVALQVTPQTPGNANQVMHSTVLEKFPLFALQLRVVCDVQPDGKSIKPTEATASQYGLVTAHRWKLSTASVYYNAANHKLEYRVDGIISWKLLGISFYAQSKTFEGRMAMQ